MARPANSFRTLGGGVPVHYDRVRQSDYGTRGIPLTFHATSGFEEKLDRCFEHVWQMCPFGKAEVITSAGAWVDKPGFHGLGRGFDLDGIFWREKTFVTLFDGFQGRDRRFYLAVEAILRIHFGQVLNYNFNAAHHDHFHISETTPGFDRSSTTATYFVQNALTFVLGRPVGRDGTFGPGTAGALERALADLGISGSISSLSVWQRFLEGVARKVFEVSPVLSNEEAELTASVLEEERLTTYSTPGELLRNIYEVIHRELGCTSLKPKIEGAVTAFASHPDVQSLLDPPEAEDQSIIEPGGQDEGTPRPE